MTEAVAAFLTAGAVVGLAAGCRALAGDREAARMLGRLGIAPARRGPRSPDSPLLEGMAQRITGRPWGARLKVWAEARHPGVPFSEVLAVGLAALLGAWLLGLLLFDGLLAATAAAVFAPMAVHRVFVRLHGSRAARLEKQLPEALALQAGALRAGQSLTQSLGVLREQTRAPLQEELGRVLGEVELGAPLDEALESLSARITSRDLDMWVTSMLVHRQTGGNLAGVIDGSSHRISERLLLRSEVRAMTAQGRLSGLVVAVAPLAFFLLLSAGSRDQMDFLFTTAVGLSLLVTGVTMNVLGMLWIRRALRVQP